MNENIFVLVKLPPSTNTNDIDLIIDELDRGCSDVIKDTEVSCALILPENITINIKMLEWLNKTINQFNKKNLLLCIITSDENQKEAIELSFPEQIECCFSNIDEMKNRLKAEVIELNKYQQKLSNSNSSTDISQEPVPLAEDQVTDFIISENMEKQDVISIVDKIESGKNNLNPMETNIEPTVLTGIPGSNSIVDKIGEIVNITGEYKCTSCGGVKMYLKGDFFKECENCKSIDTKWEITFILF